mgnify:CR=1 FL=1
MKKVALFPGSFDPFTKGHEDLVLRGLAIFDEIYITIGHNSSKKRFFEVELMVSKIEETFAVYDNVHVLVYNELTADLARRLNARFLLRGLRNTTDFEYENSIAQMNRHVYGDLETVFLITSPQYAYISSTIIREIYRYGRKIDEFIPYTL